MRQSISAQLVMKKQPHAGRTAPDRTAELVMIYQRMDGSEQTTHVLKKTVQARAEGKRTHLQSGSPCQHIRRLWKNRDWAKGGRKGSRST